MFFRSEKGKDRNVVPQKRGGKEKKRGEKKREKPEIHSHRLNKIPEGKKGKT